MFTIYTLGPAGTSSEVAARHYIDSEYETKSASVRLCSTYESACKKMKTDLDVGARAIVANAYREINHFYMDSQIGIADVFRMYTPRYGVAVAEKPRRSSVVIASHPAPVPLVDSLMPPDLKVERVEEASSTAAAAEAVARGEFEAAITTESAAERCNLQFVGNCVSFEMVWTVFKSRK